MECEVAKPDQLACN